jgi:hypothetical protein
LQTIHGGPAGTALASARLPGSIAAGAVATGDGSQLGAFVQRSMVVAPPRVSVRPAELAPAVAGPAVPQVARGGRPEVPNPASRPAGAAPDRGPSGVEVEGPVIRRSLSGTAHSLFRSLLHSPAAVPLTRPGSVQSGSAGMFDDQLRSAHERGGPPEPSVIRRLRESGGDPSEQFAGHQPDEATASPAMKSRDFDELIDRIVAKLEQRILDDLERRGRRHMPEVF